MPIRGQLWYLTQGAGSDVRLTFINSDGTNSTGEANYVDLGSNFPEDVVLDTAAGLYYVLVTDGGGTNASILVGQIGSAAPPVPVEIYDPFGEAAFALHLDPFSNKLYVSFIDFNNFSDTTQGIKVYDYDPSTGALSNEQFLITQDTAQIDPSAPDGFGLFIPRDYDFDFQRGFVYFAQNTLGDFTESNMVWRLDLNNPTAPAVPLAPQAQFPLDGDGSDFTTLNGIIVDIEVDVDSDRAFFTTHAEDTTDATGEDAIWMVANASTADGTLPAVKLTLVGVNLIDFYPGDIAYDEVNNVLYVESEHTTDGASPDDDVILVFQLDATGTIATLVNTISPGFSGIANIGGMQFNGLPVLDDVNGNPTPASEQGAAVTLLTGTPDVTDVDGGHLASATVAITGGTFAGSDAVDNLGVGAGFQQSGLVAGTNITVGWNQLTSTLTLTGYDTIANYEAVLAMVRYQATGDDPDNAGANPTRTITWTVSDGSLGIPAGEQNSATTTLNIAAVNDDPVNTTGGAVATSEDAASVAVTGLSVSDVDSANLTVTLSVGRGTLTLASTAGLSFGAGDGTADATMTFSGTAAAINAALAGLSYTPTANVNGADSLTMATSDGAGGSDSDNVAISVAAVNDAPTVAGDGTEDAAPIVQDMPSPVGQSVASLFAGQYSDATDQVAGGSSADAFAGVAVTANGSGASGQWQYFNGATWVNIGPASDGAAVLLSASTSIRFNPAPGFFGAAPTLTTHLVDASGGALTSGAAVNASVTGGTTRYSTGTVVLSETVLAGNTAPTGVTGTLSVQEVSANGTLVGTLTAADPDSSTFTYTLVNDAGGRFDINFSTGAVTVENGLLLDYEQNASHTIRVRVDDNEGGVSEFDVNVTVTDRHGELVIGDGNNHTYYGGIETDILTGGLGSDVIHGGGGTDLIGGGNGIYDPTDAGDQLFGEAGSDVINGNGGDDTIAGGADGDVLIGAEGNDTIYGGSSANDATPSGNDIISGDAGNDLLYGNDGNDELLGGDNDDQLFGGAGLDVLDGGSGIDRLNGGAGADDLTGGAGFDVFIFRKGEANGDEIMDFDGNGNAAGDSIRLEGYAAGTTFTKVSGDTWKINDHGFIEFVTIHAAEPVKTSDWVVVP